MADRFHFEAAAQRRSRRLQARARRQHLGRGKIAAIYLVESRRVRLVLQPDIHLDQMVHGGARRLEKLASARQRMITSAIIPKPLARLPWRLIFLVAGIALFGLIVVIFGLVLRFDPEARRAPNEESRQ